MKNWIRKFINLKLNYEFAQSDQLAQKNKKNWPKNKNLPKYYKNKKKKKKNFFFNFWPFLAQKIRNFGPNNKNLPKYDKTYRFTLCVQIWTHLDQYFGKYPQFSKKNYIFWNIYPIEFKFCQESVNR